jgi:hypothetical protein
MIGPLNPDRELPAIPVNLLSGFTHLEISLPSRNGYNLVEGLSLLTTYLTAILLAKNLSEVVTVPLSFVSVDRPFPISLFCGLTFEELAMVADSTLEKAESLLVDPNEVISPK